MEPIVRKLNAAAEAHTQAISNGDIEKAAEALRTMESAVSHLREDFLIVRKSLERTGRDDPITEFAGGVPVKKFVERHNIVEVEHGRPLGLSGVPQQYGNRMQPQSSVFPTKVD